MQNEISMGDLMNAINSLEVKQSNQLSQAIIGVETRLNTTSSELMNVIRALDSKFTARFDRHDIEFADLHEAIQLLAETTQEQFEVVNLRFVRLESQMVTKDYLDEKMGDLRGDMIQRIRTGFPKLALK